MSKLEDLIQKLCPNGVEWKELGEVCEILNNKRKPVTKKDRVIGEYPYYGANGIQDYVRDYIFDGIFLLIGEDGSVLKEDNSPILNWATGKIWVNNHAHVLSEKKGTLLRYLYHVLQTISIVHLVKGTPPKLNQQNLRSIKLPLPPLEIQKEIVHILDSFTELTNELTNELTARRKQYEHYRDSLLTFGDEVEWKKLGDIGKVSMCKRVLKNQTNLNGEIPFFKIGTFGKEANAYISKELFEEYKKNYPYPKKGDILISASGTIGRTIIFDGSPSYFQDSNIVWIDNDEKFVLNKFLYYLYRNIEWNVPKGGTISRLYNDNINKTIIPIPPLSEQERIVSILDKFDSLCNDITKGLPAEIEVRKKQYEYYRDKLLTFKDISENK